MITMWVYACHACMRLPDAPPLDFSLQGTRQASEQIVKYTTWKEQKLR